MRALAILIALGACTEPGGDVPGDLSGQFELVTVRSLRAEGRIAGIDADGAGGLWIAYSTPGADYYALDEVRLVHLDRAGHEQKVITLHDEFLDVQGIAVDGHALWINYSGGDRADYARKIDAATGATLGSFGTEAGVHDLDVFDGELRMSIVWDQLIGLDLATGGQRWRAKGYLDSGGAQRGVASMADRRAWVSTLDDRIYLLDPKGGILGAGHHDLVAEANWTIEMFLAWDGEHVIAATGSTISWLEPR